MKQKNIHTEQKGFIALLTVVIISSILLSLVLVTSGSSFSSRVHSFESERKRQSLRLAQACAHIALVRIAQDYFYIPESGEVISEKEGICKIESIEYAEENTESHSKTATILTRGTAQNTWSALRIEAKIKNPSFAPLSLPSSSIQIISSREI